MTAVNLVERKLTGADFGRLNQLALARRTDELGDLLDFADVLEAGEVPANLVTLDARVEIEFIPSGRRQHIMLCSPGQSAPGEGHISVLSPVGMALIGLGLAAIDGRLFARFTRSRTPASD